MTEPALLSMLSHALYGDARRVAGDKQQAQDTLGSKFSAQLSHHHNEDESAPVVARQAAEFRSKKTVEEKVDSPAVAAPKQQESVPVPVEDAVVVGKL